ncbi:MAG: hypothetical protein SFU83_00950 [Meiothermus sp.]|nr:hypothetical protein [Meiothermus sp.]
MVVSGNLEKTPFHELVGIISKQTGILELWNLPGRSRYTLYIKEGNLRCLQHNGQFVEPLQTKAKLLEIMGAGTGLFELSVRWFKTPVDPALNWPLERVLLSLTIMDEEIKFRTIELVPPGIRFKLVSGKEPNAPRNIFWQKAKPHLQHGINAQELARLLGLSEEMICYYFSKLERQQIIEVQRAQPVG